MKFTILANHQAHVLTKTAALFSRFGLTIEDWRMSAVYHGATMQQHIQVACSDAMATRIQKQLQRMVDVHEVHFEPANQPFWGQVNEQQRLPVASHQ
ncbi:hypothetical protein [Marinicella rhabdoformis]|uniref:hypothetical protein n=1 Tax=Marinicella rhabdoformis TaxID=2580566 RepID=UPI0012AEDFA3|nr:hypothetical protein [Marinicella rhabdoformis]